MTLYTKPKLEIMGLKLGFSRKIRKGYKMRVYYFYMSLNLKGIVFGIAVFVLALVVSIYGVNTIYNEPEYEDFCPNSFLEVPEMNESICFEHGGKWQNYDRKVPEGELGYCDRDYMCREAYELKQERYSMNLFLISVPLGILILIGGFYFVLEFVSIGVMVAGVGTILRGVFGYWKYSEDWLRFLISLVGLGVVIFFANRYVGDSKKKVKKKYKKDK